MSVINNQYRVRGKLLRDPTGMTQFFLPKNIFYTKKIDSFSWMFIEYQTKNKQPLVLQLLRIISNSN